MDFFIVVRQDCRFNYPFFVYLIREANHVHCINKFLISCFQHVRDFPKTRRSITKISKTKGQNIKDTTNLR